jgi:hypothetical protein
LYHDGIISEDTLIRLSLEIDAALNVDGPDLYEHVFGVPSPPKA